MAKSFLLPRDPMSDDIPNSYGAGQQYGTNAAQNGQNLDTSGMARAVAEAAEAAFRWTQEHVGRCMRNYQ
jgi:hypothetical protein